MRRSPFFIALAAGLSTAALTLSSMSTASADEAGIVDEATEQASEVQEQATDAADNAADAATGAAEDASNAAESAGSASVDANANAATESLPSSEAQVAPSASAGVDTEVNTQNGANIQGSAGTQTRLDAQGRPLADGQVGANAGADQQLNTDLNANPNQARLNAQQSGELNANGQLSIEAIDQRLGLQFNQAARTTGQGLTVSTIQPNSVLYSSGLRQGDVLLSVDNRPFANRAEFVRLITTYQQDRIPLIVMRNGQRQTIYFSRPADFVVYDRQPSQAILGVTFDSKMGGAAVIRSVTPHSPAEQAGIMPGDVITGLNGKPVSAAHEVVHMVGSMHPGQEVTIDYSRNEQKLRAATTLAARAELNRHEVGYPPEPGVQPIPAPAGQAVIRENRIYQLRPTSPGDPDGDGRRLDGDGRIPRRVLNRR